MEKVSRLTQTYSHEELEARNDSFLASNGMSARDGRLWDEAWDAARSHYTGRRREVGVDDER